MRIAVLADIHGNVLALDAVLADLERRGGADITVNLGDSVSGPLWPRETFARLEALDLRTVRGNHDRRVAADPADETMWASDIYARERLTGAQREVLFA
ncbi:metallophosphoesterase family protein [Mesorhizobium sp. BR1-1-15]|nr:metallophosphoesterase [Mesorhizobium sp. BR1-1-15]MBZ9955524.1 metallophosphatase family protein [Mesorhizobium sp. BR1-1-15]